MKIERTKVTEDERLDILAEYLLDRILEKISNDKRIDRKVPIERLLPKEQRLMYEHN